jgi:hypothetical protein
LLKNRVNAPAATDFIVALYFGLGQFWTLTDDDH